MDYENIGFGTPEEIDEANLRFLEREMELEGHQFMPAFEEGPDVGDLEPDVFVELSEEDEESALESEPDFTLFDDLETPDDLGQIRAVEALLELLEAHGQRRDGR